MLIKTSNQNNVHIIFLIYWCVLVLWQSISGAATRSGLDLIIKVGLIGVLAIYYVFHSKRYVGLNSLYWIVFSVFLLISFITAETFSTSTLIAYAFPCIFVFLAFVLGNHYEISKKQLIMFFNIVICVVVYMAIYAVLFCQDQFRSALSISSAYGNELTSFLISNHEYGLYLIGGITGCLICLSFKQDEPINKKLPYVIALIVFVPNLILTFSRTSLLGMMCILVMYLILGKKSKLKRAVAILSVLGITVICTVPVLRGFFFRIVFKENTMAGRDTLTKLAVNFFNEGTVAEKLFGHGITSSRHFFEDSTSHGSVHNAYLQILIYFGLAMFVLMILFLLTQLYANLNICRKNRFCGAICTAMISMSIAVMITNTACIFNSAIDSYFLTVFAIIIPKYVRNSINAGTFE